MQEVEDKQPEENLEEEPAEKTTGIFSVYSTSFSLASSSESFFTMQINNIHTSRLFVLACFYSVSVPEEKKYVNYFLLNI